MRTRVKSASSDSPARATTIRLKAPRSPISIALSIGWSRLSRQILDYALHPAHDQRKPIVVQFVRRIGGLVIMRITKWRGVRDHDGRITALPERPLVRPADSGNGRRKRRALARNPGRFSKRSDSRAQK